MAGWYRTGTVSLATGSANVVGNGTSWAGAVRHGATFTTDFVRLYEVVEVADDRHLTLDRPYEASVEALLEGGGQSYAIIFATGTMSNAEIAAELMAMVGKWQVREDQYDDWVAGEPDGGPNGDGRYPLTDSKGVTRLVTSPGRLLGLIDAGLLNNVQQVVDAIRDDIADAQRAADVAASAATTLKEYVDSAHQSGVSAGEAMASAAASADLAGRKAVEVVDAAAAAANHAETAVHARTGAEAAVSIVTTAKTETLTARDGALEAKATVVAARDRVQVLAGETQTARDTVVASTGTAAAAARTATDAAGTAQNAATDSVNAKVQAVAAQVVAEQRRNEAAESAATAKAWANNPAGVPVVSGGYSAYHWMELARGYAMTAQTIATGSTFSNVGDGAATRITAQAAGETLHLVQGAGMIVNFDQATRRVTFSSIARAVATDSPALTVRLDDAANLAFLGIDPSKIDHGSLAGVGTHGHADIDQHLDNATIHVPVPGSGDVDKLLKATGAGTFAWVKGTGSGIDADKLDGLSWEEGVEVPANGASGEWVKLGTWNANGATAQGRRLLIQAAGSFDYSNDTANTRAGLTTIVATMGNGLPGVADMEGQFAHLGTVLFDAVKFVQGDGDRYTYAVYAKRQPYAPFNFKVQCNGAWTSAIATGQADPGADSDTVRAAANLGRLLTATEMSQNADANTLVQRDSSGGLVGTSIQAIGTFPGYYWYDTDSGADAKRWGATANNGSLAFQTINDAWNTSINWLEVSRSGNTPTRASFKVPVQVALGQLGTAAGTEIKVSELGASDGNADFLRAKLVRVQTGANWTSAAWRLQRTVDITDQGFIQFGSGSNSETSNGAGLGAGNTLRLWVPNVGDVTIDNAKVWTSANFDPATKAGTAVATVAANGLMPATDRQMLGGATAAATAGALVQRDNAGAAAFTGVKVAGYDVVSDSSLGSVARTFKANPAAGTTGIAAVTGGGAAGIETQAQGNGATAGPAMIAFHRPGAFGAYFGLDTDNEWRVGGWSYGPTSYRLWHEGNQQDVRATSTPTFQGVKATGSFVAQTYDGFRHKQGAGTAGYGVIHRNDGGSYYILLTANNDADGVWNGLRPFRIDLPTGRVTMENGLNVTSALSLGSRISADAQERLRLSPVDANATGQKVFQTVTNSGANDGSPNAVHLGVDGAALSGRAFLDTGASGVAAPTPLDLRINGVTHATLGTNGVMDFKAPPTLGDGKLVSAWETISTTTVSSMVSSCAISLPSGFRKFKIVITRLIPATEGPGLYMQGSAAGPAGPYAGVGNYWYSLLYPWHDGGSGYRVNAENRSGGAWATWQISLGATRIHDGVWGDVEFTTLPNLSTGVNSKLHSYPADFGASWLETGGLITAAPLKAVAFVFYMPNSTLVNITAGSVTLLGMR